MFFVSIILPTALYFIGGNSSDTSVTASATVEDKTETENNSINLMNAINTSELSAYDSFILYDTATGDMITLSERDFLIGSLISEMSYSVPIEALKAQNVASYSYYSVLRAINSDNEYHISFNSEISSIYTDPLDKVDEWGENYDTYISIYEKAVDETLGQSLSYDGQTAYCTFFECSNGSTESACEIWGDDIAYLTGIASPYDNFNNGKIYTYTFTPDEISTLMNTAFDYDVTLAYSEWFSEITYTAGGCVSSVNFCTFTLTGEELRLILGLSSPCFELYYDGENFVFNSQGVGSQVGMSQTGAAYMAAEGATYIEILSWYYSGTELCYNG